MVRNILTLRYHPHNHHTRAMPDGQIIIDPETAIRQEIEQKLVTSKPKHIVIPMSGGIDSAVITSIVREVADCKVSGLTACFDGDCESEVEAARKIAEAISIDLYELHLGNIFAEMPLLTKIAGEPRANLYNYYVVKEAKRLGADMIMTGDGGDELFGGYTFRYQKYLDGVYPEITPVNKVMLYLDAHQRDWVPDQEAVFGERIKFNWADIYNLLTPYFRGAWNPLDEVLEADWNGKLLNDFMPTNAKFYDHFGMDAFAPMLTENVMRIASLLPSHMKYSGGMGKIPLRKILGRRELLQYVGTSKKGFGPEPAAIWKEYGMEMCLLWLDSYRAGCIQDGLISQEFVDKTFKRLEHDLDNPNNIRYINKMYGIMSLEVWYQALLSNKL